MFHGRGKDPLAAAVLQGRLPEGGGGPQAGSSPKFGEDDEHGGRRPLPPRGGETTLRKGRARPVGLLRPSAVWLVLVAAGVVPAAGDAAAGRLLGTAGQRVHPVDWGEDDDARRGGLAARTVRPGLAWPSRRAVQ